jgi:hypothetical protein
VRLNEEEPHLRSERVVLIGELLERLTARRRPNSPLIVAIDGRSSNGKTTFAARLAAACPSSAVVHTDDVAWWHSRFGWDDLLVEGVIAPLRGGRDVAFRPPAWDTRGREGAITVDADAPMVIIEGVGAGRRSLRDHLDTLVWVQSDLNVTATRDAERVAAGEIDQAGYDGWMAEEIPFQADQRTWESADIVVAGTPKAHHDPETEVIILE